MTRLLEKTPYLFPHPQSQSFDLSPNALRLRWLDALERAKKLYQKHCLENDTRQDPTMFDNLRWHDLRHSAITRLASIVPDSLELSRISGH